MDRIHAGGLQETRPAPEPTGVSGSQRFGLLSAGRDRSGWRPDAAASAGRIIIIIIITRNRGFEAWVEAFGDHRRRSITRCQQAAHL
jgi:hypothetical protein